MADINQLTEEIETYEKLRGQLVESVNERYVLVRGSQVVGSYATEQDAISEGYRRFGNVPFLVKQVTPVDRPLNFVSGLIRI